MSSCFVRLLDLSLPGLRENEMELFAILSKLPRALPIKPTNAVMHQVRDMKVLLAFNT